MEWSMIDFKFDEVPFRRGMGTINASGASKTLNGSSLTDTEILLREAVQNSFDSRLKERKFDEKTGKPVSKYLPLNFSIRAFSFSSDQMVFIQKLFNSENSDSYYAKNVQKYIKTSSLNIEISDINTTGLIGFPGITEKKENQNFANFVYFTGNDKSLDSNDGGSYGFGKAAFFLYSQARTIIIYTRIKSESTSNYQSRLIAVSMDERIDNRCWWGEKKQSDNESGVYASPILGKLADEIAEAIGMNVFNEMQTGTKILILNSRPRLFPQYENGNEKTIDDIFRYDIPQYLVHWYWNKIIAKKVIFDIAYKNEKIELDNPYEVYPYKYFINAYKRLNAIKKKEIKADGKRGIEISQERPSVKLGIACIEKTSPKKSKYEELIPVLKTSQPLVAFMRGIGNIVYYGKYTVGPENLNETCFGVFACDTKSFSNGETEGEIDRYFRGIENQTHTRWEHKNDMFPHNYLKTVENKIDQLVRSNCLFEEIDDSAANISVMIQRTLGAKLLPYKLPVGGAKKTLKPAVQIETKASNKKSSIAKTGNSYIKIDSKTNEKYVYVQYKINVLKDKAVKINNIVPKIETLDAGDSFEDNGTYLKFSGTYKKDKDGTVSMTDSRLPKIFKLPETCYFKIKCQKDCSFDLKIDWEEVDAQ